MSGIPWFLGCAGLLLTALVVAPTAIVRADQAPVLGTFFKITGEVECNGERIVYDDVIENRFPASDGIEVRRSVIIRALKSGEGLMMQVPSAFALWPDLNPRNPPNPLWKDPTVIARKLRPPPEFLPIFYWINNLADSSVIEAYLSEAYYQRADSRLKIIKPIKLVYVEPSVEADRMAVEQTQAEPQVDLSHGQSRGWHSYNLFPIDATVWRKVDAVAQAITASGDQAVLALTQDQRDALFTVAWPIYREHWSNTRSVRFGVPQPSKYPAEEGEGLLYGEWIGHHGDGNIPLDCIVAEKRCSAVLDRTGYEIFYFAAHTMQLQFNSKLLDLSTTPAFYDRKTNKVYLVGNDLF